MIHGCTVHYAHLSIITVPNVSVTRSWRRSLSLCSAAGILLVRRSEDAAGVLVSMVTSGRGGPGRARFLSMAGVLHLLDYKQVGNCVSVIVSRCSGVQRCMM